MEEEQQRRHAGPRDPDPEDLFDRILLAEDGFRGRGYRDGFQRGSRRGYQDGRRHGARHGALLGSEVNFYLGFALTWRSILLQVDADARTRRRLKALDALLGLLDQVPLHDPQAEELQELTDRITARFRQVCSLLDVPADLKEHSRTAGGTSF